MSMSLLYWRRDTVLRVWPYQFREEGQNHFPPLAFASLSNAAQDNADKIIGIQLHHLKTHYLICCDSLSNHCYLSAFAIMTTDDSYAYWKGIFFPKGCQTSYRPIPAYVIQPDCDWFRVTLLLQFFPKLKQQWCVTFMPITFKRQVFAGLCPLWLWYETWSLSQVLQFGLGGPRIGLWIRYKVVLLQHNL